MRRTLAIMAAGGVLTFMSLTAFAGDVRFAQPPTAKASGEAVEIAFAASAASDVQVEIRDAAGNVVRHLAAGLLGDRPPAPLAPGLTQKLVWDGKDDFGKAVRGAGEKAGFSVRVGLGTRAKLGKVLFHEPGLPHDPRAAAVGPDGLVYVLSEAHQFKSTFLLQAYTREGQYAKTIMPYPADLPADRLAGLPRTTMPDGRIIPAMHHAGFRDLYPNSTGMRPQRMLITSKGTIVLVNASKTHNAGYPLPQRLLFVDTDGGTPRPSYLGPLAGAEPIAHGFCWLAMSPDEKWIYASGQRKGNGNDDPFNTPPHEVVYRIGWDDQGPAKPLIGELFKPGDDQAHLSQPRGIDTDAAGRIYVADWGNNRVAVFDAEGKWAGKIDVASPDQVAVGRKAGAVYVLTWKPDRDPKKCESKLLKFAGLDKPASASVEIGSPYCTLTLDNSAKQPTLWLARTFWENPAAKRGVEKVVDLGDKLTGPVEVIKHRSLPDVYQIAASMAGDDVFVHSYSEHRFARVDGRTGEVKLLDKIVGHDVAVGPTGELFVLRNTKWEPGLKNVEKFDRDGQPVKFAALDSNVLKDVPGHISGHGYTASKGFAVSPRGQIVVADQGGTSSGVSIYNPDGTLAAGKAIDGLGYGEGAAVMDLAGNLYVATGLRPKDELVPKVFGSAKTAPTKFYAWMYGSIVKFPPAGGKLFIPPRQKTPDTVWPPPDADKMLKLATPGAADAFVRGATWVRPGFSVVPGGQSSCACYVSRFAVDPFGRVFIPDVGQFSVFVVDANNNELLRFGDYGNEDSVGEAASPATRPAGAAKPIKSPPIPLAWPYAVSIGNSGVYVSDFLNRRILRVDLTFAAEAMCEVR